MSKIEPELISGMGYVGTSPGVLYRMTPAGKHLTAGGGSTVVINGAKDNAPLDRLTLHGGSTQGSTTGAQLFDKSKAFAGWVNSDGSINNAGTVGKGDNIVSEYIPFEAGKQYFCGSDFVWIYNTEKGFVKKADTELKDRVFTSPDNAGFFVVAFSISAEKALAKSNEIMINVGSVRKPYEPYTGGKPSPSPEYPQEIESAGQSGEIGVTVYGGNLLLCEEEEAVTLLKEYKFKNPLPAGEYRVSIKSANREPVDDLFLYAINYADGNSFYGKVSFKTKNTIMRPTNAAVSFAIYSDTNYPESDGKTTIFTGLMLNAGSSVVPYEPYKPAQKLIIPTPGGLPGIPVSSGGNYTDKDGQQWICDEIDLAKGERVKWIGKTVVDGGKMKFVDYPDSNFWNLPHKTSPGIIEGTPCTSRYFAEGIFEANSSYDFIYTRPKKMKPYFDTPEELNAFCVQKNSEGNPLTIYYCMDTPIRTPLPPETIAAYKALRTYSPTTTVINDAGAGMSVGYKGK